METEADLEAEFDRAQADQAALEGDAAEPESDDDQRYTRDGLQEELDTQSDDGSGATSGAPDGDRPPKA